jgi:DNA repair protein RecO (recombination protein O)
MALIETESLVLKSYNLAEADKIVVLLTRYHGIVRGVAKGAKRLKSKFGSGLEPFSVVHATYFQKEVLELVSIQKIDIIQSNFAAASSPDFLQKFSFLSDLLIAFLPPHDPNETLYRMAKACIDTVVADPESIQSVGVYFETWLLKLSGYLPDWGRCDQCGRSFDEREEVSVQANFHLLCQNCQRASRTQINAETRLLVSKAMRLSPADFSAIVNEIPQSVDSLSRILRQIISHSIGKEIAGETSLSLSV